MLRIEVTHTFDVSVAEAFAYITDMNWPEYWPDFIRIENPAAAVWGLLAPAACGRFSSEENLVLTT